MAGVATLPKSEIIAYSFHYFVEVNERRVVQIVTLVGPGPNDLCQRRCARLGPVEAIIVSSVGNFVIEVLLALTNDSAINRLLARKGFRGRYYVSIKGTSYQGLQLGICEAVRDGDVFPA